MINLMTRVLLDALDNTDRSRWLLWVGTDQEIMATWRAWQEAIRHAEQMEWESSLRQKLHRP